MASPNPAGGTHPPVILASQSPRRRQLLGEVLAAFHVVESNASELEDPGIAPRRLCELNAERKAWLVAERYPDHLVLGADTLVFLDEHPLGKPADLAQARSMLLRLSGRIHEVVTGVALVHRAGARLRVFSEATRVRFRELTPGQVDEYLAKVHVLDKAGAYAVQDHGHLVVESVEGSYSNVVGLPVEAVRAALAQWPAGPAARPPG